MGREQRFSAQSEEKKLKHHRGYPNHGDSDNRHSRPGSQEWTVNQLEFQPSPKVTNSSCNSWRHLKYQANCRQYRNYSECEYCPLKSSKRQEPISSCQFHRALSVSTSCQPPENNAPQVSKCQLYKEKLCWLDMKYLPTWLDMNTY